MTRGATCNPGTVSPVRVETGIAGVTKFLGLSTANTRSTPATERAIVSEEDPNSGAWETNQHVLQNHLGRGYIERLLLRLTRGGTPL
jgi:hypothetical protein